MVASDEVSEIDFNVNPRRISSLFIRRCNNKQTSGDMLLINGSATFHNTHLDAWSARPHRGKLYLGKRVYIKVRPNQIPSWAGSTDGLSTAERDRILSYIRSMNETRMEGTWWEQWRGYIAGILAVAVARTKLNAGLSATAKGLFFLGAGGKAAFWNAGLKAFGSAAGPAILLGSVVGAAVYFIPWTDILSWLAGKARSFETWISEVWAKLHNWCIGRQETSGLGHDGVPPGGSSAAHGSGFVGARGFQSFPMMA
ncbi:hypothetical protein KVR01_004520 [Diaporthe batatas]|uniref:uncharacterized protein n=1 Tax=Diaporthe batatas TaxID=748121 RepID=UPI001D04F5AA|nr:uncharacterized protein KVR01_004520 [Diaporthe batatas]KAG8165968.1 hypothetical protein KVR01_004520 [Diaporthe batatas]